MKKYYIMHRNSNSMVNEFLCEFSKEQRDKIEKRINIKLPLLLVEKTCNKDNTETYTNMWTIAEGCEINWTKYTKGRIMYDYTGIIYPLIHENGSILTWTQYVQKDVYDIKKL